MFGRHLHTCFTCAASASTVIEVAFGHLHTKGAWLFFTRVVNVVTTTNGWAPIIYGQGNQLNHEYPGRFYADSCCEWRKRCLVTDILYFCTDDEVTACNATSKGTARGAKSAPWCLTSSASYRRWLAVLLSY